MVLKIWQDYDRNMPKMISLYDVKDKKITGTFAESYRCVLKKDKKWLEYA